MSEARAELGTGNSGLFRFGFICFPAADHPQGDRAWTNVVQSWQKFEVAGLVIYHHHEVPLRCQRGDSGAAVLIGEAFASPAARTVESVLSALLAAEADDLVFDSFDALSGRFALLLLKGSVQRAFHDPIGSRSLFYRSTGGFCIGSHAELIARAFDHRRSRPVREFLASEEYKSRTVKYLPGDLTLYKGLHALAPNNYYDIIGRRTVRYWPRQSRRSTNFDDFFGALDDYFVALVSHLRGRYSPILGVTGGIDTRTIISAFCRYGLPFQGVTWLRRTGGVQKPERALVEALAAHAGIEHTYLELGRPHDDLRGVGAVAKRNVGNYWRPSPITPHMHQHFAGRRAVFVRGYGAEVIRGYYNLSNPRARGLQGPPLRGRLRAWAHRVRLLQPKTREARIDAVTASELLSAYNTSMRKAQAGDEPTRLGRAAFEGFIERANYDERLMRHGFDVNDVFYWEHRMGMWGSSKHNEMDPAVLSITGFNSREVYETAFGMDARERLTKGLLLEVVRRYDERMAEIPFL